MHTEVAARVFKVKPEDVTKEMRRKAKVINFGILYGMGVNALKTNLGGTRQEAQEFYNQYFATFPVLAKYLDQVKAEAERKGYTATLFGRRRTFEGFKSPLPYIRAQAERMAINAPIQGTQADIIKLAMVEIDEFFKKENLGEKARLLLQIHDELIYEIDEKIAEELSPKIQNIMVRVLPEEKAQGVPILTSRSIGKNWGEMKKI